jgi:hypothetical protein
MNESEEIDDINLIEILLKAKMKHENILSVVRSVEKLEKVAEGLRYMKVREESLSGLENTRQTVTSEIEAKKRYLLSETAMTYNELRKVFAQMGEI